MGTDYPETGFEISRETEAERVLYTAHVATDGFWERKRFALLPEVTRPGEPSIVVLPRLEYNAIPDFWPRVAKMERAIPMRLEKDLLDRVRLMVEEPSKKDLLVMKKRWSLVEPDFWAKIRTLFPESLSYIERVQVRLSRYGSICSYEPITTKKPQTKTVYVRLDADVSQIAEAIITAWMFRYKQEHVYSWEELEAAVDLLMQSGFAEIFPDYRPTLPALLRHRHQELQKSRRYLRELGVPLSVPLIELVGHRLEVAGKAAEYVFSPREERALKLLYERGEHLTTFDEMADCLWGEEGEMSLYALNKTIQRVRRKLIDCGLPVSALQTIRKRGYVLSI
jgi:hypothetical protein